MSKKNIFGFATYTAVAAVGLSLLSAGCGGDGGSTSPNTSLTGANSVIFQYDLGELPVAEARYSFSDSSGNVVHVAYVNGEGKDLKLGEANRKFNAVIPKVPKTAQEAHVAYYDQAGSIVAVGFSRLEWNPKTAQAVVANPIIAPLDPKSVYLAVTENVLAPNDETDLQLLAPLAADVKVNLIAFATLDGVYGDVLKSDPLPGNYKGFSYEGEHGGVIPANTISASIPVSTGNVSPLLSDPIYVTHQQLTSLSLLPLDMGASTPTVDPASDSSKLLAYPSDGTNYILNGSLSVAMKAQDAAPETAAEIVGLESIPFQVEAVYTDTQGKGPQPQGVDLRAGSDITVTNVEGVQVEWTTESLAKINITKDAIPAGEYKTLTFSASFKDDRQKVHTDNFKVQVYPGSSLVKFYTVTESEPQDPQTTPTYTYAELNGLVIDDTNAQQNVELLASFEYSEAASTYQSEIFTMPASVLPLESYPAATATQVEPAKGVAGPTFQHTGQETYSLDATDMAAGSKFSLGVDATAWSKLKLPAVQECLIQKEDQQQGG